MSQFCRASARCVFAAGLLTLLLAVPAAAQFGSPPVELSGSINLDEADSGVRAHLARIKAYVADQQWDEAIEALRQVMENHGAKMIPLTRRRYINLADYCHVQIASLTPEALALYRERVDPLAQQWYEEGLAQRNAARLNEVVDKMFCSSWADDALWALGELELERGHYGQARRHWERLIELPPARVAAAAFTTARNRAELAADEAALVDRWYEAVDGPAVLVYRLRSDKLLLSPDAAMLVRFWKRQGLPPTHLAYPGTDIPLADVRARLVMVSIMEGSLKRAREELDAFVALHPGAEGRLAGRVTPYSEALTTLLTAAETWPAVHQSGDWLSFAGSPARTKVAGRNLDLGGAAWEPITLGEPLSADLTNSRVYSLRRPAEDTQRLLSYHPLVVGDLVLVNNHRQVFAFNLKTGEPAWPSSDPKRARGEIYVDESVPISTKGISHALGVPRFTMTVHENKLFARMGSQVTSHPLEFNERGGGTLVCLDLAAQGRLVWRMLPNEENLEDDKWSFEGSPVVDGSSVYVAMRKSDVQPQAHVACFDLETRRPRWRVLICSAETPGGGQIEEITHNLLTLAEGTLYYNTNLGAVAAISTSDGHVQWATVYPRAKKASPGGQDRRTAHFYRDLNPCVFYRGKLLVAPADCESIFALDAANGELIWETNLPEDTVHLLGVGRGNLLASGDTLWWIDAERGRILKRFPEGSPMGRGRGVLMGDQVIWPTDGKLYAFDQVVTTPAKPPHDPIELEARGATNGNLVPAGDVLLIAGADRLYALRQQGSEPAAPARVAAQREGAQRESGQRGSNPAARPARALEPVSTQQRAP